MSYKLLLSSLYALSSIIIDKTLDKLSKRNTKKKEPLSLLYTRNNVL